MLPILCFGGLRSHEACPARWCVLEMGNLVLSPTPPPKIACSFMLCYHMYAFNQQDPHPHVEVVSSAQKNNVFFLPPPPSSLTHDSPARAEPKQNRP